ncbi:MAG: alginate lyase family protein [Candidatus Latescibacterota bacterium]|nr:alginate lyase family protein [Candidatus Latescibacterota bacterium]
MNNDIGKWDDSSNEQGLDVFLLDSVDLVEARSRIFSGVADVEEADRSVLEMANAALISGPFSVKGKDVMPPNGNKNDYMSLDPYWWPDENKDHGLPYIFNGEKQNPECEQYDRPQLAAFTSAVDALCMGYYFTDYEDFAARAALLLRSWFVDEETKMNPNLTYAGFIPGRKQGSPSSIMESRALSWIPDHVGLLSNSEHWSPEDREFLGEWFISFVKWLIESPSGLDQRTEKGQNGTWYDVQVATMSLFTGRIDVARDAIDRCFDRAEEQIDDSGAHHLELKHCDGIYTAANNLLGLFDMADLGRKLDMDLWSGSSGHLLRSALDWFVENDVYNDKYSKNLHNGFQRNEWVSIFRRAGLRWSEGSYEFILNELKGINVRAHRAQLLYPYFK